MYSINGQPSVAVIGAGFSGLCAAIQVKKQLGIQAQLYEISSDIGGTWHANTYPGCACDIPSPLYSFSFELNPNWSHHYSPQKEIHEYMKDVAQKYNIYQHTRFNTEVIQIAWLEDKHVWRLESRSTNNVDDRIVVEFYNYVFFGPGPLRVVNKPTELRGFTGISVHTAQWDKSIDFANKTVAVVGSGASAIQAIPVLQKTAKRILSYQRTPAWIVPRDQFKYSRFVQFALKHVPFLMRLYRNTVFFQHELYYIGFGYHGSFISKMVQKLFEKLTAYRLKKAGRMDLIPILTPSYPLGCKRIVKSENYLEALAKPNVTVIPRAVKETFGNIVVDTEGNKEEVDVLVMATGFNVQGFLGNLQIYGRQGLSLQEEWLSNFPEMYKGTTIHGFPNFFLLLGANVGLGHNSVVTIIECQVNLAIKLMKHAIKSNIIALEPKLEAQKQYVAKLRNSFKGTVWKSGCSSWYLNKDGDVFGLWPGTVTSFWWNTKRVPLDSFIQYRL
ncbi:hypothetical protein BDF20DRAFT_839805 [Mycotypha africana]|uniref:uncharacterized protein n=1 Tax=Mycotypha africana TaxID=64632 RepID=UPI0022FFD347|nr:uncharacterized protein BDF20DRAFT_839805 [Mycotypha africana]KAI8967978.1 hypothetical protein BDF20DRAFT_839805 [Mycotypha africana]